MDFPATAFGICHPTYVNCNLSGCGHDWSHVLNQKCQAIFWGSNSLILNHLKWRFPTSVAWEHLNLLRFDVSTFILCIYICEYLANLEICYMYIHYIHDTYIHDTSIYIYDTYIYAYGSELQNPSSGSPAWQRTSRWRTCRQPLLRALRHVWWV